MTPHGQLQIKNHTRTHAPQPPQPQSHPATARQAQWKRVEAAIEFSQTLYTLLAASPADAPAHALDALLDEANKHIDKLDLSCPSASNTVAGGKQNPLPLGGKEADGCATRLWNLCTRLRREFGVGENGRLNKLLLCGRVLGFYLLVVVRVGGLNGAGGKRKRWEVMVHSVKLGLKVARDCVEAGNSKLATSVLQKVADYKGVLQEGGREMMAEEEVEECNCLEVEYFIVRTALCWKDDRLDLAEHMYTKSEMLHQFLTPDYAERLADVMFEIGRAMNARVDYPMAVKWLERANRIINGQNFENLSREGAELRMAITQALVTALLGTGRTDDLDQARKYVDCIESEVGRKLVVSLLRLELLQKTPAEVFDSESYGDTLRGMIREFAFSEPAFKLIIHHIRKLHDKSPASGSAMLDEFIVKLSRGDNPVWMEKAVVTRMWMITSQRDTFNTLDAIHEVLSKLSRPLSAEAAVAAQALVWKKLESNYSANQFDLAESWCRLSLLPVFQNCGPNNTTKLERKLLLCTLSKNDLESAVAVVNKLCPQSWKDPMTAYLAFKVAIRTENRELAVQCLNTVGSTPDHVDYLGACIAESQKVGDIFCAIAALKKLQENYEYKAPNPIHLPALFRCTIRLLQSLVDAPDAEKNRIVPDLCDEFDSVVLTLEKQKEMAGVDKPFNTDELEWFSRNAYNLALKNTTKWDLRYVVRMLTACVCIISYFPPDLATANDISLKSLFARFIISSALIALARTQDNVEKQRRDYGKTRVHVAAFDRELSEQLSRFDEASQQDLVRKHATLLAFEFEAAVSLGEWEDLGGIVQRARPCKSIVAYQAMADTLLRGKAPGEVLYATMRKLVNEIWILEAFDAVKLAKYTRCLFQATLPLDDELAMKLLDEACSKARELREGQGNASWPEEELEWMATTAFNHALDCFGSHEVERARKWATKAINLAHYCSEEGKLEQALQEKYLRLNFDGPGPGV